MGQIYGKPTIGGFKELMYFGRDLRTRIKAVALENFDYCSYCIRPVHWALDHQQVYVHSPALQNEPFRQ